MSFVTKGLMVVAAAATLAVTSSKPLTAVDGNTARRRPVVAPAAPVQPTTSAFTPAQMEYYLGEDGVSYIRPGLKIKVNKIEIRHGPSPGRRLQPDRRLRPAARPPRQDDAGRDLDELHPRVLRSGHARVHGVHDAHGDRRRGQPERGCDGDPGEHRHGRRGRFTDLETGHGTYKFAKVLPENYDKAKTTTLGIYATRNLTDILGKNYYANVEKDFRPDGGTIAATDMWDKIKDGACNNCHDPLALHGGSRRDVKLCVLCHSTQTNDPETGQLGQHGRDGPQDPLRPSS